MTDEELLRYSRHIFVPQIDITGQQKISKANILVIGLGGLGSSASLYLAAAGIGTLHLADFDNVEISNLQRQIIHNTTNIGLNKAKSAQKQLQMLNPHINIIPHDQKLSFEQLSQLTASSDVILDCTDNFTARDAINRACVMHHKPLVSASAIGTNGQITTFDLRDLQSPCYQCLFAGDEENLTCSQAGVLGPIVGILGAMQALEALKIIAQFGTSLTGKLLCFDALSCKMRTFNFERDLSCPVCNPK